MNNKMLEVERDSHNLLYGEISETRLKTPLTWDNYYESSCVPPYEGGSLYGLDQRIFLDFIGELLQGYKTNIKVLDYACGSGELSTLVAQKGFSVCGFDVSDKGIENAKIIAHNSGVEKKTAFHVANAQDLPFQDEEFDLVLGKAVLHHIIKYPGTAEELYRVMKPASKAAFLEGAAGNPLIRLVRLFTIREEFGDVPLTFGNLKRWAAAFSDVAVTGYFFLYMLKRFGFQNDNGKKTRNFLGRTHLFNYFLKGCLAFDELMINQKGYAKRIGGRYLIQLQK